MTNEDLLTDLKQFITATVGQSEERLRDELGGEIAKFREEVQEGFAAVGEAVERIHTANDTHKTQLDDHGHRIQRLERRAA